MQRKKLFLLSALIVAVAIVGFSLSGWNDKTTIVDYINNGGPITDSYNPPYVPTGGDVPVWSAGLNMPAPTRYHGSGVGYTQGANHFLYCLGGDENGSGTNSSVLSIYNITANTWSTGAPAPQPVVFYNFSARLGDTIYLMGGIGNGGAFTSMVNNVQRYHVPSNTWSAGRPLPLTMADAEGEPYQDSLVYVIGGLTSGTATAGPQVFLYNRTSGFRPATNLPAARSGSGCCIIGDTIVVVGGGTGYNAGLSNTVYKGLISSADRSVITWSTAAATYPGTSRHRFDGERWGCQGMVIGLGSASGFTTSTEMYRYSPGLDAFTVMPSATTLTSASFSTSVVDPGNIWRYVSASGLVLIAPFSIPQVQRLTDTLCPAPPGFSWNQCRRGLNILIPDNNPTGIRDTISVTGNAGCTLTDINIRIDTVIHTWDADLNFTITHNATTRALITARGGSGDNFIQTVLDDQAANPISSGVAPFTGSFRPEQTLNGGITGSPSGPWILHIFDNVAADSGTLRSWCIDITFTCPVGGIQTLTIPNDYRLNQNYPNPFNPTTTINFGIPKSADVRLTVYDILGREVAVLVNEFRQAGLYDVKFDASSLASGVYFYRLDAGEFSATKRMLLVK